MLLYCKSLQIVACRSMYMLITATVQFVVDAGHQLCRCSRHLCQSAARFDREEQELRCKIL